MSDLPPPRPSLPVPPLADPAPTAAFPFLPPPAPPHPPLPPQRPRVWPVFVAVAIVVPIMFIVWTIAFALWFAINAATSAISQPDAQARVHGAMKQPMLLIPVLAAIEIGIGGIALCGAALSPLKLKNRLALAPAKAGWLPLILLPIATLGAGAAAMSLIQLAGIHANQGTNQIISDLAHNSSHAQFALLIFMASLFPAVSEELLFRGYAQTRLIARWGAKWGIALSAIMFGLIHMDPVQTPDMILLGCYLGWVAYRKGSTRSSILCHLINNAVAVGLAFLRPDSPEDARAATTPQKLIMLAVGLGICTLFTWLATKFLPSRPAVAASLLAVPEPPTPGPSYSEELDRTT
jgi:uncharacterized protein